MIEDIEGFRTRGDKKVLEQLNAALSSELTAIVHYIVQAEMCGNPGVRTPVRIDQEARR